MHTNFSSEYLKGKRKLGRSNRTGKATTKMNIRTTGFFDVRQVCPTQNRFQWGGGHGNELCEFHKIL